jgi:hypothetical protein
MSQLLKSIAGGGLWTDHGLAITSLKHHTIPKGSLIFIAHKTLSDSLSYLCQSGEPQYPQFPPTLVIEQVGSCRLLVLTHVKRKYNCLSACGPTVALPTMR